MGARREPDGSLRGARHAAGQSRPEAGGDTGRGRFRQAALSGEKGRRPEVG